MQVRQYVKTIIVPMYHCSNVLKVVRTNCLNNQANGQTKKWKLSDDQTYCQAYHEHCSHILSQIFLVLIKSVAMHMYGCLNGIPCMYQWCLHPLCYNQLWMNLRFDALSLYLGNWLSSRRKRTDLTTWVLQKPSTISQSSTACRYRLSMYLFGQCCVRSGKCHGITVISGQLSEDCCFVSSM